MSLESDLKEVNIPPITFMYTLDQIAGMLNMPLADLRATYLYYHLRSTGRRPNHQMIATNIAPEDAKPEWRVDLYEFMRWLKRRGVRVVPMVAL